MKNGPDGVITATASTVSWVGSSLYKNYNIILINIRYCYYNNKHSINVYNNKHSMNVYYNNKHLMNVYNNKHFINVYNNEHSINVLYNKH